MQDCHNGRDASPVNRVLTKVGASAPNNGVASGFDSTKISNAGNDLPVKAALGTGANDWARTRDNLTGFVWAVKTSTGFRSMTPSYVWSGSLSAGNTSYAWYVNFNFGYVFYDYRASSYHVRLVCGGQSSGDFIFSDGFDGGG